MRPQRPSTPLPDPPAASPATATAAPSTSSSSSSSSSSGGGGAHHHRRSRSSLLSPLLLVGLLIQAAWTSSAVVMAFQHATRPPSIPQAAVRAWVVGAAAGVKPEGQQQQQSLRRGGAAGAVCAHCGDGGVGRRGIGYRRRRPQGGFGGGEGMGMLRRPLPPPSPAASTTTALQALLTPEYDIIHVAGDVVAGFVGGAVGVVGTMVALEVKMRQVNERSKCPYCSGSGQLTCARCFGSQTVSYKTVDGQIEQHPCPSCLGAGTVTCINCKGDGLAIPVMLDKKVSRDPETRLEEYGMG